MSNNLSIILDFPLTWIGQMTCKKSQLNFCMHAKCISVPSSFCNQNSFLYWKFFLKSKFQISEYFYMQLCIVLSTQTLSEKFKLSFPSCGYTGCTMACTNGKLIIRYVYNAAAIFTRKCTMISNGIRLCQNLVGLKPTQFRQAWSSARIHTMQKLNTLTSCIGLCAMSSGWWSVATRSCT